MIKMQTEQNIPSVHSPIINLPPEIFAKFCSFLSPTDLFVLLQVCRTFFGYLCAPNSISTQQIWKKSRLQFMKEVKPPPEGMNEKKYIELLITERGCQICKRGKECKIYWEFKVRCCEKCFLMKTVTQFELHKNNYPRECLNVQPYVRYYCENYYWRGQINFTYLQYHDLSKENLQPWLDDKKHMFDSIMEYAKKRKPKTKKAKSSPFYSPFIISATVPPGPR